MPRKYWLWSCTSENWETVRSKGIWATYNQKTTEFVCKGDQFVFYIKGTGEIQGIYEVVSDWYSVKDQIWADEIRESRVKYPYQIKIAPLVVGRARYMDLVPRLSFVEKKHAPQVYIYGMGGGPVNFRKPISVDDYSLIRSALEKPSSIRSHTVAPSEIADKREGTQEPNHDKIRDMIKEIGLLEKMYAETEFHFDHMILDAIWKRTKAGVPAFAFEVQIGGNYYEALSKLKHSWDKFNSRPVLVTTEKFQRKAEDLLGGSFHEMEEHIRVINWKKIVELHEAVKRRSSLWIELEL